MRFNIYLANQTFWNRLERYVGTDWTAMMEPVGALRWNRFSDTISLNAGSAELGTAAALSAK